MVYRYYKECIEEEVYKPFKIVVQRDLSFLDKLRCKFLSSQLNAVYPIRKMLYYSNIGG